MSSSLPSSVIFLTAFPLHLMSLLVPCVPGSLTSTPPVTFSSLPSLSVSWSQPESCHDQKLCYLWHFYYLSHFCTISSPFPVLPLYLFRCPHCHKFAVSSQLLSSSQPRELGNNANAWTPFPKNPGGELGTSGITFLKLLMWLLCIVRVEIHYLILWL